uniref:Transmembrane protein n=1 Tax=Cacopsylla melanoneura TaxID=428564 RepID=A0A8D9F535_9HEMI
MRGTLLPNPPHARPKSTPKIAPKWKFTLFLRRGTMTEEGKSVIACCVSPRRERYIIKSSLRILLSQRKERKKKLNIIIFFSTIPVYNFLFYTLLSLLFLSPPPLPFSPLLSPSLPLPLPPSPPAVSNVERNLLIVFSFFAFSIM